MSANVIVQIASASTGGIGRLTRDISDVLNNNGIENYIAYGRGQIFNPNRDFMFGNKIEIVAHGVMTRLNDKTGLYSRRGTKQLIDFLDIVKPSIIQLHNLHGYYLNYEMLFDYIKTNNIAVVWTLHDCWSFTGHCTHYTYEKCYQWKDKCLKCVQLHRYPASYLKGNVKKNYQRKRDAFTGVEKLTIVTPSQWLAEQVKESFLKYYPIEVINNGIDLSIFRIKSNYDISKYSIPDKKIVLGLASTWGDRKGESDFIKLSKILPSDYVIVLVGYPRNKWKKLPQNIYPIEHTENVEELVDLYNAADIFLNLTYEDTFPTTNLEAMACGTSVITYKTGGSPESVIETSGYIVKVGDLFKVRDIVLIHKKTKQTMLDCRKHACEYDKKNKFEEYLELYKEKIKELKNE